MKNNFELSDNLKYEAMFKNASEGIMLCDEKGIIKLANHTAHRFFGYFDGELLHRPVEDLIPNRFASSHEKHREGFNQNPHSRSMGIGFDLFGKRKDN